MELDDGCLICCHPLLPEDRVYIFGCCGARLHTDCVIPRRLDEKSCPKCRAVPAERQAVADSRQEVRTSLRAVEDQKLAKLRALEDQTLAQYAAFELLPLPIGLARECPENLLDTASIVVEARRDQNISFACR